MQRTHAPFHSIAGSRLPSGNVFLVLKEGTKSIKLLIHHEIIIIVLEEEQWQPVTLH
jgi:hypothetical protein